MGMGDLRKKVQMLGEFCPVQFLLDTAERVTITYFKSAPHISPYDTLM